MGLTRLSNLDRALYRIKCREKLSKYISKVCPLDKDIKILKGGLVSKLGILITLVEVRLITSANDPYT